ncbi:MAG: hypothetical protein ACRDO7_14635 [Nocardioidaceae bacterium]
MRSRTGREGEAGATTAAADHGWTLLFPESLPFAGGPNHYAAYLTNTDGYEVELVATR